MNQRNGTDVDAANAMKVFTKLGYKVKIYNDQTVEQMKQVLTSGEFDAEFKQNDPKRAHTQVNTPRCRLSSPAVFYIISYKTLLESLHSVFFSVKGRSQLLRFVRLRSFESWR